ncbi:hypothetical protein [Methylomonas sp. 11b]|uniref:hypothetical protein n=1 Tax=Methylomonas sp. 11b TaxID=1168169 RepID=UPI0012DD6859|nr:hypothetical protein [Methylomonas sp. 11b]
MIRQYFTTFLFIAIFASNSVLASTILSGTMTVDDAFSVYVSTSESSQGEFLISGDYWPITRSFNFALEPSQTYYLHVVAQDVYGSPSGFLGSFNLSDSTHTFSNGTQSLSTNSNNWFVNTTGFGAPYFSPTAFDSQTALSTWGTLPGIDQSADWIWSGSYGTTGIAYFSTVIAPVPIPSAFWLFFTGTLCLNRIYRRAFLN